MTFKAAIASRFSDALSNDQGNAGNAVIIPPTQFFFNSVIIALFLSAPRRPRSMKAKSILDYIWLNPKDLDDALRDIYCSCIRCIQSLGIYSNSMHRKLLLVYAVMVALNMRYRDSREHLERTRMSISASSPTFSS